MQPWQWHALISLPYSSCDLLQWVAGSNLLQLECCTCVSRNMATDVEAATRF